MNGAPERSGPRPERVTDGGRILFEETLSMTDEAGARKLVGWTRVAVVVVVLVSLVAVVLVGGRILDTFLSTVGGTDAALALGEEIVSEQPLVAGVVAVIGLAVVAFGGLSVVGFLRQLNRAVDTQIHTRVTDDGVAVRRSGSQYWRSSGVAIPFDAITAVEYLDPEASSTRVEVGDWRSKQFFGGRSRNWVRLERAGEPTVYVGSDRPLELAETVARNAPEVETADPY